MPSPLGWCSAQRIQIIMIAGGNHTTIYQGAPVRTLGRKRAFPLGSPFGGAAERSEAERALTLSGSLTAATSPKGRGKSRLTLWGRA